METNTFKEPTNEEKLLSMFSHLSLFMGGIILPIIIWAIQKDKSRFTKFHSLQAIWFHIVYVVFIVIFVMVFMVIIFGGIFSGTFLLNTQGSEPGPELPVFMIVLMVIFYIVLFAAIFGVIGYSIYMGVKSYKGELIKYPVIGNIIYRKVYGDTPPGVTL